MIRLLRFKDLQARGIINNWPMLKRRIANDGFPPGRMIGANSRAWVEEEVEKWIKSRPTAGPAPKGVAKNPRRKADSAATATTA
jgi:predicted DNA-binding transcriptional regulator AlpA